MVIGAKSIPLTATGTSASSLGLGISPHESGIGHATDASLHDRTTAFPSIFDWPKNFAFVYPRGAS